MSATERKREDNRKKESEGKKFSSIFSLIIHLQWEVQCYQFCNIKWNVNRDREFTFIHFRIQLLHTANGSISHADLITQKD